MLACICVPPAAVRSHRGWPQDAPVQVTLSRLRAQNRVHTDGSEYGFPGRQGLAGLNVAVCFTLKTPRVLGKGLLLGQQIIHGRSPRTSGDAAKTARWASRENSKDGGEASAVSTSKPPTKQKAILWGGKLGMGKGEQARQPSNFSSF